MLEHRMEWEYVFTHSRKRGAAKNSKARLEFIEGRVASLLIGGPSGISVLKEIVAFLEAEETAKRYGPASESHYYAGSFIELCELPNARWNLMDWYLQLPSVAKAIKRQRFRPTVAEIADHLGEVMGDKAPDYKTVERYAEAFGSKSLPPKAIKNGRKQNRQFWEW